MRWSLKGRVFVRKFPVVLAGVALLACAICFWPGGAAVKAVSVRSAAAPAYDKDGNLLPIADYRQWIYLSSGLDMSYTSKSDMPGHSMFDNVFVNPEAYRSFLRTGTWPDKTVMVLEVRGAEYKGSINQLGKFQTGDIMGFEVHVKDASRFPGKWAFFDFDSSTTAGTLIPPGAPCYTCHRAHAAVDTTFVQFYPTLLPIAQMKGTLSASFLKETASPGAGK